jgi:hypothetical protein
MTDTLKLPAPDEHPMSFIYMPMMKASALINAGRLGIFHALADGPLMVPALANAVGASEIGIRTLADFLVTAGYLEKRGEAFANTEFITQSFTKHAELDCTPGLLWMAEAWDIMSGLTYAVKTGMPEKILWDRMKERPDMGTAFSDYMRILAEKLTQQLVEKLPLPSTPLKLLDLGGSHGVHAVSFCHRYPELSAVIFDMESALTHTDALLVREGLSHRITTRPGNLLDGNWGSGYDMVFYFWVAHNQTAEDNHRTVKRIYDTLNQGGLLIIIEDLADEPLSIAQAAFRLTLLTETATRTYSYAEITAWLVEAGFESTSRIELGSKDSGTLILARKTG